MLNIISISRYLDDNNLLDALPLDQWYGTCFAGILPNQSIIRIWDKIIGGSHKIIVYVFITMFSWIWRMSKLSSAKDISEVQLIIDNVRNSSMVFFFSYLSHFVDQITIILIYILAQRQPGKCWTYSE